jgi:organic hydroperoxide reductase OsmC/OhrA
MADLTHVPRKSDKQFLFEVQLKWLEKNRAVLWADDVSNLLHVATPVKFGGEGKEWSPEHLFLNSITSSYMTTFLLFAKKISAEIIHFECSCIGQIEIVNGKYKFTNINLYPKIYIQDETLREKAILAVQKTQNYCLVANSVDAAIIYHTQVLIDSDPLQTTIPTT